MTKPYKCRVEYLESTGTQYIDTGINTDSDLGFDVNFKWDTFNTANSRLLGVIKQDGSNYIRHHSSDSGAAFAYFVSTERTNIQTVATTGFHKFKYDSVSKKFNYDGTEIEAVSPTTFDTGLDFWLFGRNGNIESLKNYASVKIHSAKLYNNSTLVRDFIPVLDNNGRPAMYDNVSKQLFYNAGTGEFTYGRQIIPVEYLESTGTQYIDTGYKPNTNTRTVGRFRFNSFVGSTANYIFGVYASPNNYGLNIGKTRESFNVPWGTNAGIILAGFTPHLNTDYEFDISKTGYLIDGQSYGTISADSVNSTRTMYLFWSNGTTTSSMSGKMYYCKIYDNNILVRDFIPCVDENNIGFMFDRVSNVVFDNVGTGQFKVGPNVERKGNKKLLRRKLALMLASLKKKRKYYCELEYLKSTGTQYIDLNFIPNNNSGLDMTGDFVQTSMAVRFGQRTAAYDRQFCIITAVENKVRIDYGTGGASSTQWSPSNAGGYNRVVFDGISKTATIYFNDETVETKVFTVGSFTSSNSCYLFAFNNNGTAIIANNMPVKTFKLYDNGTLIRDLIPVLDWDMTPCMYDKVTEQLFYNAGTGSFIAGRQIHQVEYLESTGTQYIDTGINPSNNTKVDLTIQQDVSTRAVIIGSRKLDSSTQTGFANGFGIWSRLTNGITRFDYGGSVYDTVGITGITLLEKHNFVKNGNLNYLDGAQQTSNNSAEFTGQDPLYLFGMNNGGSVDFIGSVKMYYAKIWDNGILVRDYIPAIDENDTFFMFDKITHTAYNNAGSGSFIGPTVQKDENGKIIENEYE